MWAEGEMSFIGSCGLTLSGAVDLKVVELTRSRALLEEVVHRGQTLRFHSQAIHTLLPDCGFNGGKLGSAHATMPSAP